MIFWMICGALGLGCVGVLMAAVQRGAAEQMPPAAFDMQVYRAQLAEVERDLARGIVNAEDAERARTEISRRILAADAALQQQGAQRDAASTNRETSFVALLGVALVTASGALYLNYGAPGYGDLALKDRMAFAEGLRADRPAQTAAEASLSAADLPPVAAPSPDYVALVEQLRSVVTQRPDDVRGLRLLAVSERNLGNYAAAREAFAAYVSARGADATPQEYADLADMMVIAAGGYVSPEAEVALARALDADPSNGPAQYYWGLMLSQTGRPDQAFRIWDQLLRLGPPEAAWIPPIQAQIEQMAFLAGVNYTMPAVGTGRGPTADDIRNASDLSPQERIEMVTGMVANLSERLATEGGTVGEWAQLITALGVLERREDAFAVHQNALEVFKDDPTSIDIINRAGDRAGVVN